MNDGAFIYKEKLFSNDEIMELASLAKNMEFTKRPVHEGNSTYSSLKWFQVNISHDNPLCRRILNELGVVKPELFVFYYLDPGASLHPHRDLTGATLNNRIRFHVPVITNPKVEFIVDGDKVVMRPGDLWCLDTSYVHSVKNSGDDARVHIIVECDINDKIKSRLPSGIRSVLHNFSYVAILVSHTIKALIVNSVTKPKYFVEQVKMIIKFIKWRILKIEKPK